MVTTTFYNNQFSGQTYVVVTMQLVELHLGVSTSCKTMMLLSFCKIDLFFITFLA